MSHVYLVGAGPGDPELLTVRALFLLRRADVVLHDALISQEILALISQSAKVIDVGKRCGRNLLTQEEINALLVYHAQNADTVVRLKGGDPTIFGRVGEEISAIRDAGISYEIVPGITSALAGAAAAGISLTDRRFASSVVFATAHRGSGSEAVEWDRIVSSQSTLVIYMPGRNHSQLREQLKAAGLDPNTACAVVSCAGRAEQSVLLTSINKLGKAFAVPAPSLLIVGRCAGEFANPDLLQQVLKSHQESIHREALPY
jgi:uroporphyrin-III C-methyltransferase